MKRILVTGATGTIGPEVIQYLSELSSEVEICAAVRNKEHARSQFSDYPNLKFVSFDFEAPSTFDVAFQDIDQLFLLRPPHLSDIDQVFKPLLEAAKARTIKNIVFLSVQGAGETTIIPHAKIERLIQTMGFTYTFVRPSYFMQNLTTTLRQEIVQKHQITLPAGSAKFNWVDARNVGEFAAHSILKIDERANQAFDVTGQENLPFSHVADLLTELTENTITYKSINPVRFYFKKKNEGLPHDFALVMTALHFIPRLQSEPEKSDHYQNITGKSPNTLRSFLEREIAQFTETADH